MAGSKDMGISPFKNWCLLISKIHVSKIGVCNLAESEIGKNHATSIQVMAASECTLVLTFLQGRFLSSVGRYKQSQSSTFDDIFKLKINKSVLSLSA